MLRTLTLLCALLVASLAAAQTNTLTFTAATTTGDGSVVPALTWSTTPAATGCNATGPANWAGVKAAAGTVTLPAITVNATYVLTCTWSPDTIATLTWTNPTKNTDGSNYTNPQDLWLKYRYGAGTLDVATSCSAPVTCVVIIPPTSTMRSVTGFTTAGTVNFAMFARNTLGVVSDPSMVASKTFTGIGDMVTRSVAITVNPKPDIVTGLSVN